MTPLGDAVFNPLHKTHLAESVRDHLLKRPLMPLPPPRFRGAGIYAIYYAGPFPAYSRIVLSETADELAIPIYVGKAIPAGSRRGALGLEAQATDDLYRRLRDHAGSIAEASNIDLNDFRCRYLLVDDIWIPLGESLLIATFKPIWNMLVDGFGHHDQGASRRGQMKSAWDTLHPGRGWSQHVERPNPSTVEDITQTISDYLARVVTGPPPD